MTLLTTLRLALDNEDDIAVTQQTPCAINNPAVARWRLRLQRSMSYLSIMRRRPLFADAAFIAAAL